MDAYVLVEEGDAAKQTCQRWLNGAYIDRGQFFVGPATGTSPATCALVLGSQYQGGMTDN